MSVYYLLHVPKTGGITLAEHLQAHCAPGILWRPLDKMPAPAPPQPEKVRVVAMGHYQSRAVENYFPGRQARRILLLRDPLSLQLSFYNWRMIFFRGRGMGTYSFDLHLKTVPRNFMLHFLLRRWMGLSWLQLLAMPDSRKLALAQKALADFWFVGDSSDCDRIIATLAPDLGVPAKAARRNDQAQLRDFVSWTPLTADDLTPGQRQRLMREHALDRLLWETWRWAGFNAGGTPPAKAPKSVYRGVSRDLARPLFELARLARRTPSSPRADLSLLQAAPDDPAAWRAYLDGCRDRPGPVLPAGLVGTPDTITDPVLCALKAEALLCSGQRRRPDFCGVLPAWPGLECRRSTWFIACRPRTGSSASWWPRRTRRVMRAPGCRRRRYMARRWRSIRAMPAIGCNMPIVFVKRVRT
jgi:hypothetical protein